MRRWTGSSLVQIMAWRLFGAKAIIWTNAGILLIENKLQWNWNRNSNIFIQEFAFENVVCKMTSILSRPKWVKRNDTNMPAIVMYYRRLFPETLLISLRYEMGRCGLNGITVFICCFILPTWNKVFLLLLLLFENSDWTRLMSIYFY